MDDEAKAALAAADAADKAAIANDAALAASLAAEEEAAAAAIGGGGGARLPASVPAGGGGGDGAAPGPPARDVGDVVGEVLNDSLAAIKLGGQRLAALIKKPAGAAAAEGGAEPGEPGGGGGGGGSPTAMAKLQAAAAGLGARAKVTGGRFLEASGRTAAATAEVVRRMAAPEPVQALVRAEAAQRPVPALVLACCTFLTAGAGLSTRNIFAAGQASPEAVAALAAAMHGPRPRLLQPTASPHAVAELLKQFLCGLPEPLLTYRALPAWVAAADAPDSAPALLAELPAANANTLRLLLQLFHAINERAAATEMDALALASELAPCVAWKPPAPRPAGAAGAGAGAGGWAQGLSKVLSMTRADDDAVGAAAAAAAAPPADGGAPAADAERIVPLDAGEREAIVAVLTYLVQQVPHNAGL